MSPVRGFTTLELVVTIVIVGIITAVAIPRLVGRGTFDTRGFTDQVRAALEYSQAVAVGQRRNVCVSLGAGGIVSVQKAALAGSGQPCTVAVTNPTTGGAFALAAPNGVSISSPPTTVIFDALGAAGAGNIVVTVTGDFSTNITVERFTGYVR
jgi:MSHA pilin protein MshC